MRIGVLCSSRLALPTLFFLAQQGVQLSIILPKTSEESLFELEMFAGQWGIPLQKWNKQEVMSGLNSWMIINELNYLWVMTFPYIIEKKVIKEAKIPMLNFHFAPLPKYRGAQPIFWMIKNREKKAGISIHTLTHEIDAGPIIHQEDYALHEKETFGSYLSSIAQLNVKASAEVLHKLAKPNWETQLKKQVDSSTSHWGKPVLEDVQIHWQKMKAEEIEALCRACNPWNKGAITSINGVKINLVEVAILKSIEHSGETAGQLLNQPSTNKLMVSTVDQKYLDLRITYLEAGFFSNTELQNHGLSSGLQFQG